MLRLDVFQNSTEPIWAHRKRPVTALPEKAAIPSIKVFDSFRGCFLYPFNELSLGSSSRKCRDNVNVIGNTADTDEFGTDVVVAIVPSPEAKAAAKQKSKPSDPSK